ncbi:MAG: hypothetical protein US69_C0004G0044, partial [candidate division TM6 bacterium GW2011_GWF2_38_10]
MTKQYRIMFIGIMGIVFFYFFSGWKICLMAQDAYHKEMAAVFETCMRNVISEANGLEYTGEVDSKTWIDERGILNISVSLPVGDGTSGKFSHNSKVIAQSSQTIDVFDLFPQANYASPCMREMHDDFVQQAQMNYEQEKTKAIDRWFIQQIAPEAMNGLFCDASNKDLFKNYHLFASENYMNYIRSRPGYDDFILYLYKNILENKKLRKSIRRVSGFKKHGFQQLIEKENQRITNKRTEFLQQLLERQKQAEALEAQRLERKKREEEEELKRIAEVKKQEEEEKKRKAEGRVNLAVNDNPHLLNLAEEYVQCCSDSKASGDCLLVERYQQRAEAIKTTIKQEKKCFDYSNLICHEAFVDEYADIFTHCYGTALDQQLHFELCSTRASMQALAEKQNLFLPIKNMEPLVNHFSALAKIQNDPKVAFCLADACHYLFTASQALDRMTEIVQKGLVLG